MALSHPNESLDMEATITLILGKGTLVTRTDTMAVLNMPAEVVAEGMVEGYTFNLPLFNTVLFFPILCLSRQKIILRITHHFF